MHTIYITPEDNARLRLLLLLSPYTDSQRSERDLLRQELDRAAIVTAAAEDCGAIGLGAAFEYEDIQSRTIGVGRLCLPGEQAGTPSGISVLSRFGAAVIGCCAGNEVWWAEADRCRRILIRKVWCNRSDDAATCAVSASEGPEVDRQCGEEYAEMQPAIWAGSTH